MINNTCISWVILFLASLCGSVFAADNDMKDLEKAAIYEIIDPTDTITHEDEKCICGLDFQGVAWRISKGYASPVKTGKLARAGRPSACNIFTYTSITPEAPLTEEQKTNRVKKHLEIFDWVCGVLESKLKNSPTLAYQESHKKWLAKKDFLRDLVDHDSFTFVSSINTALRGLGLSHMGFRRLFEFLGIVTKTIEKGYEEVIAVEPGTPAALAGIKPKDVIVELDDKPATQAILRSALFNRKKDMFKVKYYTHSNENKMVVKNVKAGTAKGPAVKSEPLLYRIKVPGCKGYYLSIPSFFNYDPSVIHEKMKIVEKADFILVDLRNNFGGNCTHFLSYLLAPGARLLCSAPNGGGYQDIMPGRSSNQSPQDFSHWHGYVWGNKVTSDPFPFQGHVVFIVNQNSCSAAELCPLIALEHQSVPKPNSLYAKTIGLVGRTLGRVQNAGHEQFYTDDFAIGDFQIDFPGSECFSALGGRNLENVGLLGAFVPNQDITMQELKFGSNLLYFDDDLEDTEGLEVLEPERQTNYGFMVALDQVRRDMLTFYQMTLGSMPIPTPQGNN